MNPYSFGNMRSYMTARIQAWSPQHQISVLYKDFWGHFQFEKYNGKGYDNWYSGISQNKGHNAILISYLLNINFGWDLQ